MKDQIGECIEIVEKLKADLKPKTFKVAYTDPDSGWYYTGTATRTSTGIALETDYECSDRVYKIMLEQAEYYEE